MAVIENDFERFLYANYPIDYNRASVEGVKDDVIAAIKSKHSATYNKWKRIPEWIKNEYQDKLPTELLNGNVRVKDFVYDEIDDLNQIEEQDGSDALFDKFRINNKDRNRYKEHNNHKFVLNALALGYSAATVSELEKNRELRKTVDNSPEGKEARRKSRLSDKQAIDKDWKKNSNIKSLMHAVKEVSRAQQRSDRTKSERIRVASGMKVTSGLREIDECLKNFDTPEKIQQLEDFLLRDDEQRALRHLTIDLKETFFQILVDNGVHVEKFRKDVTKDVLYTQIRADVNGFMFDKNQAIKAAQPFVSKVNQKGDSNSRLNNKEIKEQISFEKLYEAKRYLNREGR